MELTDLRKIGLTEGEIKLYSALLDLGESTRTELAKESGISPSKIYDVANRLLEKGLISSIKKNNIIHFAAASPDKIKDFIKKKEEDLEKESSIVDDIFPLLLSKYKKTDAETDIEVFYGWEGMKTCFDHIIMTLGKNEFNYILGASKGYSSDKADIFFNKYYQKKKKKGFGTKIIFNENLRTNKQRTFIFKKSPNQMRFLRQETFTEINLYKDIVLIIMLLKKPTIIRIKNKEAALSFKTYFDSLWKIAKK